MIGMWFMAGPACAIAVMMFFAVLFEARGIAWQPNPIQEMAKTLFQLGILALLAVVTGALLHKTTRNYLRLRHAHVEAEEDDDAADEKYGAEADRHEP